MKLGRYELIRRLGRGGMAEVFEARLRGADGFERRVAVKRVIPDFAEDPSFRRMFLDEAKIASRLHHRNIAAVLDYGVVDGVPFQVLELIDGSDARTLTREGARQGPPIPLAAALYIVAQIGRGLHHAHEARDAQGRPLRLVHRDVTPGNMLVSWSGDVKLSDFGIAFAADRAERTSTGVAKGKLAYMPPEQALAAGVDRRSDIFALGCSLHALLTGRSPVSGQEVLAAMLRGEPLPVDHPGLSPGVAQLVRRATMPAPRDRFPTAHAFVEACEALPEAAQGERALRSWLQDLEPKVRLLQPSSPPVDAPADSLDGAGPASGRAEAKTRGERPEALAPPNDARGEEAFVDPPNRSAVRSSKRGTGAAVTLLFAVLIAVGLVAWRDGTEEASAPERLASDERQGPTPTPASSPETGAPPTLATAGGGVDEEPAEAIEEDERAPSSDRTALSAMGAPVAEGGSSAVGALPDVPGRSSMPREIRPRVRERRAPPAPPEDRSSAPRALPGWLSIFGPASVRARIYVDGSPCCDAVSGRPYGYAPKRIPLTEGTHRVSLERPDGETLGPFSVTIRESDTEGHPQRLRVAVPAASPQ